MNHNYVNLSESRRIFASKLNTKLKFIINFKTKKIIYY